MNTGIVLSRHGSFQEILDKMGKYVGLSPYGYNLGYGKFNVVDSYVAPSVPAEEPVKKEIGENGKEDEIQGSGR